MLELHIEIEIDAATVGSARGGSARPTLAGKMRDGFVALNEALKRRAEGL